MSASQTIRVFGLESDLEPFGRPARSRFLGREIPCLDLCADFDEILSVRVQHVSAFVLVRFNRYVSTVFALSLSGATMRLDFLFGVARKPGTDALVLDRVKITPTAFAQRRFADLRAALIARFLDGINPALTDRFLTVPDEMINVVSSRAGVTEAMVSDLVRAGAILGSLDGMSSELHVLLGSGRGGKPSPLCDAVGIAEPVLDCVRRIVEACDPRGLTVEPHRTPSDHGQTTYADGISRDPYGRYAIGRMSNFSITRRVFSHSVLAPSALERAWALVRFQALVLDELGLEPAFAGWLVQKMGIRPRSDADVAA